MHAILDRLRNRHSTSTQSSISESEPTRSYASTHGYSGASDESPTSPASTQVTSQPDHALNRKIVDNPNLLLALVEDSDIRGLTPSTRPRNLARELELSMTQSAKQQTGPESRFFEALEADTSSPMVDQLLTPDPASSDGKVQHMPRLMTRISQSAFSSNWSTFGKRQERVTPRISDFSDQSSPGTSWLDNRYTPSRGRSSSNEESKAESNGGSGRSPIMTSRSASPTYRSALSRSRSTSFGGRSSEIRNNSKRSSPADTLSLQKRPQTPQTHIGSPSSRSLKSLRQTRTRSSVRDLPFESPRTFGYPTPPQTSGSFLFQSSPPPLPPLDHPELVARRSSRPSLPTDSIFSSHFLGPPAFSIDVHPFPRSTRVHSAPGENTFYSTSSTFSRSIRHHSSLPKIRQRSVTSPTKERRKSYNRPRARTISDTIKYARRSSADWCAHWASIGVNSPYINNWPARVSREMVRLSLGESTAPDLGGAVHLSAFADEYKVPLPPRGQHAASRVPDGLSLSASSPSKLVIDIDRRSPVSLEGPFLVGADPDVNLSGPPAGQQHGPFDSLSQVGGKEQIVEAFSRSLMIPESRPPMQNSEKGKVASHTSPGLDTLMSSMSNEPSSKHAGLLQPPSLSFISATPETSPVNTDPSASPLMMPSVTPPMTPPAQYGSDKSRGKRKADEVDITPPDQKKDGHRATFIIPTTEARTQRVSNSSHAPSSYHNKRARLSSPANTPAQSRPGSILAHRQDSLSSRTSHQHPRAPSRAVSTRSTQPQQLHRQQSQSRRSLSQVSIPISALVSPHAPSIGRSTTYHMRDPRRPPKRLQNTEWALQFGTQDEPGSPIQAWCFYLGFLVFPIWFLAGFLLGIPQTRKLAQLDMEKAVMIDDPQVEHDARSWRLRCRIMAVVSIFTYVPFIVLVAVFVPR